MELNVKNWKKDYWSYIIPSLISQVVFTLYMVVDSLMVARGVSPTALAGVNIASPYLTFLWALAIMFAVGTSTMVARLMGQRKGEIAGEVFTETVFALTVFSVVFSVVTFFFAPNIAAFLGATDSTIKYSTTYIKMLAPFSVFFITAYLFEVLMPIDGHPKMASIVVTIGVVSNCTLDYIFIFIFKWGVAGAAFATALSQIIVTGIFVAHFLSKKSSIKFVKFKFKWKLIGQEIWRGLPAGLADASPGFAVFIFVRFLTKYIGENGVVTYSAISNTSALLIIIAVAVGQGSQPLVSYYNGARRPDIIKTILKYEFKTVAIASVGVFAIIWLAAHWIVTLFLGAATPELVDYAVHAFRLFITFSLIDVYSIVLSQYATALEKPISGILISLFRTTIFLVIGIIIMLKIMGPEGIWLGLTMSEAITFTMAFTMYKVNHGYLPRIK